jgi:hypothetical protein
MRLEARFVPNYKRDRNIREYLVNWQLMTKPTHEGLQKPDKNAVNSLELAVG